MIKFVIEDQNATKLSSLILAQLPRWHQLLLNDVVQLGQAVRQCAIAVQWVVENSGAKIQMSPKN